MRLLESTTRDLGAPWHFGRVESGQGLLVPKLRAGPGGQGGQDAAQEASEKERSGDAHAELRTLWSGGHERK